MKYTQTCNRCNNRMVKNGHYGDNIQKWICTNCGGCVPKISSVADVKEPVQSVQRNWESVEIEHLKLYETTTRSAYRLFVELNNLGYKRTFSAVRSQLFIQGLRKPSRYATGHELRLGYIDIETTNLKANVGHMLSWCIKPRDEDTISGALITKEELFNGTFDRRITEELMEELLNYDLIFTYYGTRFDIPFIRTRAIDHQLDFPIYRQLSHKDLYYQVRSKLQLTRNSLAVATEFLGIEGKSYLDPRIWRKAAYGDKESLSYIYEHNEQDVIILEELHKRLEKYMPPVVQPV